MKESLDRLGGVLDGVAPRSEIPIDPERAGAAVRMIPRVLASGSLYSDGDAIGLEFEEHRVEIRRGLAFMWYPDGALMRAIGIYDTAEKVLIANAIMARAEEAKDK
jgi:hypothetical protein